MKEIKLKNKVAVIGTVGIPANYGGFETLAEQLVRALNREFYFTVYCSSKAYDSREEEYLGARLKYIPLKANGISSIFYDMFSILNSLFYADVILILGVSSAFMIPFVRRFSSKKIIVNVDGQEWKRAKWNFFARKYLKLQERIAVKYSHVVISDNKAIQDNISESYSKRSELIAYGGNHALNVKILSSELKSLGVSESYYFSVCRIEPENNVHIILEAFSNTDKCIVIVGNWSSSNYGQNLKKKYEAYTKIILLDAIYNQIELDKLRSNCAVYIHGHSAGGTNPSLVEAMYLQLPVFAWDVLYNRYSTEDNAFYFNSVESLKNLIKGAPSEEALGNCALKLYKTAKENYEWNSITDAYKQLLQLRAQSCND